MWKKIRDYVKKWHMIEHGDKIIVGVSGGADSICLLFVLLQLRQELDFEIIAVHVNHCLRGVDADRDEAYVETICETHHIPCESFRIDVKKEAQNRRISLEEAGREVRRERFEFVKEKYSATKIALAHHENDNVETFFMNLARGTGVKGLGGMRPVNDFYIRPLLTVQRCEIEQYLDEMGIHYCEDLSNHSDDYTRNRIRNHVVPYFEKEINVKTTAHIGETMERLRELWEFLEVETERFLHDCVKVDDDCMFVEENAFLELSHVLRPIVLKKILASISGREKDLESVHIQLVEQLFERQVGKKVDLPYNMEARRSYGGVQLRGKCVRETPQDEVIFPFTDSDNGVLCWGGRSVRYRIFDASELPACGVENDCTKWFDYDIIKDTLAVRGRRAGDYLSIHQDGRRQKLKSYFINEKIAKEDRQSIPLVVEGSHVLWVVGHRVSVAYQVTTNTKRILEIQIDEGE